MPNMFNEDFVKDKAKAVELGTFEKIDQDVDGKLYLKAITEKADELGVTICLEPTPRHHRLKSAEKIKKITREYLISYYSNFGFVLMPNNLYMERKPTMTNYSIGGL
jgi:hypothetical protein